MILSFSFTLQILPHPTTPGSYAYRDSILNMDSHAPRENFGRMEKKKSRTQPMNLNLDLNFNDVPFPDATANIHDSSQTKLFLKTLIICREGVMTLANTADSGKNICRPEGLLLVSEMRQPVSVELWICRSS